MILADLTAWLATQGIGTVGATLLENFMPPSPDSVVVLTDYGGRYQPDVRNFGAAVMVREYTRVQALVRGGPEDYETPRRKAQDVMLALSKVMSVTLSGTDYFTSVPLQTPRVIEKDGMQRYVFSVNFEFFKRVSTA